jgi:hypothetical protein
VGATKKRRNTKHRGNAAGMVETRGRTGVGSRSAPSSSGSGGRGGARVPKPANWNSAALTGLVAVLVLAVVFAFTGKNKSIGGLALILVLGFMVYVPAVYYMDAFMYRRYLKRNA